MIKGALLLLLSSTPIVPSPSMADQDDAVIEWYDQDNLKITTTIMAPNGCYYAGAPAIGEPEEVMMIENTVAVTLPVLKEGDMCSQAIVGLEYKATIQNVPLNATTLIIYESWTSRNELVATAYTLPPRVE